MSNTEPRAAPEVYDHGLDRRIDEIDRLCALARRKKCVVMRDFNGVQID